MTNCAYYHVTGKGSNDSYTFHMHGYTMQVIATWKNPDATPISGKDVHKLLSKDLITR